jgi:archaemetzincin
MNLQLLPIGDVQWQLIERLRTQLAARFRARCEILPPEFGPEVAFHAERQQYHSSEMLGHMHQSKIRKCWRLLGVTPVDLYIPILTFVFGEAQMGGKMALVSTHRLRQEFYGLPPDPELLSQRLFKEAVHELGHTLELTHCHDYSCVMSASHAVEWIDIKDSTLCSYCYDRVQAARDK